MGKKVADGVKIVPMIVMMGIIFFLSQQSGDDLSLPFSLFPGADKVAHLTLYSLLAGSTIYAFACKYKEKHPSIVVVCTVLFCLVYGVSDEFHQSFVPGRSVSIFDVGADFAGALLGCAVWLWYRKKSVKAI